MLASIDKSTYIHLNQTRSFCKQAFLQREAIPDRCIWRRWSIPYTLRSGPCRIQGEVVSYFIENNLVAGKDIILIARAAGHDVETLMKHYEPIDPGKRSREMTEFRYGAMPKTQRRSAL